MPARRRKCWSHSVGVYGAKVRVAELTAGGSLYLLWVDSRGKQIKKSLGHKDRNLGKESALAQANRLQHDRAGTEGEQLTLAKLFDIYEREGLHGRTARHQQEVRRKLGLWGAFLGPERPVESLNPADVDRFINARRSGVIGANKGKSGQAVEMTTVWHDYVALSTALNFATRHRDSRGKPLLATNPLNGVRVTKTVSPARPVADSTSYAALRSVANRLNPKFGLALDLAYSTGHRIDAILHLRWADVRFDATDNAPYGSLRWRAENDKIENEHVVPMNPTARNALDHALQNRPVEASPWVFPSDSDPLVPVDRHLANRWLRRAEKLADISHVRGRGWHAFRRGWASTRKHLPDVDVAAAGGWKDTATMKRCYQHADAIGVLRAVTGLDARFAPELSNELSSTPQRQEALTA